MDMSKPNTTIQSEGVIDDNVESKISNKLEQTKKMVIKMISITIQIN